MARIDDLVGLVEDAALRRELQTATAELRRQRQFGLVFEEYIPEVTALLGYPLRPGVTVQRRDDPTGSSLYRVLDVHGDTLSVIGIVGTGATEPCLAADLMAVQRLGEPIFPALTSVGTVERGAERPFHAVINGENYHALQLLVYLYEGQVDVLYLDPPYNTGARDWKYNNHYVDDSDAWRHSKWLSFMEKRLRLAKRLLKPDGVLIVTIDEHEVHHLGMLIERLFPEYYRNLVTIVISARGNYKTNFARVEEYAFFCCPPIGRDVIVGTRLELLPESDAIDVDPDAEDEPDPEPDDSETRVLPLSDVGAEVTELRHARRRGPDSRRRDRPSMFYPIYIDERTRKIVRTGPSITLDDEPDFTLVEGLRPVWPIDAEGEHRRWRWGRERMQSAIETGGVRLGEYNRRNDSWTINLVIRRQDNYKKLKTVWRHTSHDAGTHGTALLDNLLGQRGLFTFPKSVYAVRDCIGAVVRDRPDALIVDFFAGSGTTLHATALLNADDGGRRRCILVTSNEVGPTIAQRLNRQRLYRGDAAFEAKGIFEEVTRPRVEAVVTGLRPDGREIPGRHVGGRPFAQGFPENVEFFRLDYLDPDEVDLGSRLDALLPTLWLAAGGTGARELPCPEDAYSLPPGGRYGLLLRQSRFRRFKEAIAQRPGVTHAFLVTDSDEAFREMRAALPQRLTVNQLYGDYLRRLRTDTEQYR